MLVVLVALAYAGLWRVNTRSLAERDHFYLTYFSFPASTPETFEDWRYYLVWLDCIRAGEPTDKPCSLGTKIPWAYPSAWLLLVHTGLSGRQTVLTAGFLYIGLVATLSYLFAPTSIAEVCYDALFLVSPPFVLALERCNMDVLVFILLGLAVALASRRAVLAAFGFVWVAALLKVYPGASLLAFVRKRADVLVAGLCAGTLLVYVEAIRGQLRLLNTIVAQTEYESFGSPELFLILGKKLEAMGHPAPLLHSVIPVLALAVYTVAIVALAPALARRRMHADLELPESVLGWAFPVGALVYCACWSLGMNFNYRFTFVAMTLPQAWALASRKSQWRLLYRAYLLAALAMAWLTVFQFKHPWFEAEHALLGWVLYGMLLFTLIVFYRRFLLAALGRGTASPALVPD